MKEERVGEVIKYFAKVGVAAINLENELCVGDTVHIKGHTTDFKQVVDSMQIENELVNKAKAKDSIGIKVVERVRPNDFVYKVE